MQQKWAAVINSTELFFELSGYNVYIGCKHKVWLIVILRWDVLHMLIDRSVLQWKGLRMILSYQPTSCWLNAGTGSQGANLVTLLEIAVSYIWLFKEKQKRPLGEIWSFAQGAKALPILCAEIYLFHVHLSDILKTLTQRSREKLERRLLPSFGSFGWWSRWWDKEFRAAPMMGAEKLDREIRRVV